MGRREVLAGLGLLPLLWRGGPANASAGEATGAGPLRRDADGRPLIRATIDGHGDCDLVVDTAATRTSLTPDAVERLRLPIVEGDGVRVHGTTGATRLRLARVPSLIAGDARLAQAEVPVLPRWSVPGADGLLGTDALAGCTLAVDLARGTLVVARHERARRRGALRATHRFAGAMAIGATIGGREVPAILDTGAARTLGTPAVASLCLAPGVDAAERRGTARGVDLGNVATQDCDVAVIALAHRSIERTTVGCIALDAFDLWGFADRPALLLGMDVLGRLPGFRIDFAAGLFAVD